ncbi:MAG TPA: hypothetical protein VF898_11755 [Chloroflexota bacterium]
MNLPQTARDRAQRIARLAEKLRSDLDNPDPEKPPFDDIYALRTELESLEQELRDQSSTLGDAI